MATAESAALDERDVRAAGQTMDIAPRAPGMWAVYHRGQQYVVDVRDGACTCPDAEHRDVQCKHLRRLLFVLGERHPPTGVRVDRQLGRQQAVYGDRHE